MDLQKEREAFNKEFGIDDADTFPAFSGGIENSAALKCNWLGWKKRAEFEYRENPETIEIDGLKTIHKLCKFGADHNMEGCTFTEIVERMFDEIAKTQTVQGWISVEDGLPPCDFEFCETGERVSNAVLIHSAATYGFNMGMGHVNEDGFWSAYSGEHDFMNVLEVTHWMPLPDAPQEQAND